VRLVSSQNTNSSDEVVGGDAADHGEHEQREQDVEPPLLRVAGEVAARVDEDGRADAGDHQQHQRRQAVDAPGELDPERRHPGEAAIHGQVVGQQQPQHHAQRRGRQQHEPGPGGQAQGRGDGVGAAFRPGRRVGHRARHEVQPDLGRRRPPTHGQRVHDRPSQAAPDVSRQLRRLIEAALGVAGGVQRHRHDHVDLVLQASRCEPLRQQRAEHPAGREVTAILERMHQVIERCGIGERRVDAPQCIRRARHRLAGRGQRGLAATAQVEAGPLAVPAAQHAARRQHEAAQSLDLPVNPLAHIWLTAGTPALNTPPAVPLQHLPAQTPPAAAISRANDRKRHADTRSRPPGHRSHRLDAGRSPRAVRAAVQRPAVPRAARAPAELRPEPGAGEHAAVDQDRRLPRGLRLLPAERALRDGRRPRGADGPRRRAGAPPAPAKAQRRDALLHGRRLSQPEAEPAGEDQGHGARGARARPRDLRHARHAHARAGPRAQGRRPRLLQPQPRHVRGVLRRDHHHAHLPGPPRHARRPCATRASTSAAAASSAWASRRPTACSCC
jgi:hypothetical protein